LLPSLTSRLLKLRSSQNWIRSSVAHRLRREMRAVFTDSEVQ
jgi:hypothetical protein